MKYTITHDHSGDYPTSLQGYVKTTYAKLVGVFGEPTYGYGDKTTAEWCLRVEDPFGNKFSATVYDWKMDSPPTYEYHWHIGGMSQVAVIFVEDMLAGK